jgi:hypothetical protein
MNCSLYVCTLCSVRANKSMAQHGAVRRTYEARHNKMPFLVSVDCREEVCSTRWSLCLAIYRIQLNYDEFQLKLSGARLLNPPPGTNSRNPLPFWGYKSYLLFTRKRKSYSLNLSDTVLEVYPIFFKQQQTVVPWRGPFTREQLSYLQHTDSSTQCLQPVFYYYYYY